MLDELLDDSNKDLKFFLRALALCHSAKTLPMQNGDGENIVYTSERREETTILEFARSCSSTFMNFFHEELKESYQLNFNGRITVYEVVGVNPYDHNRGRFSIVLRNKDKELQSGYSSLICKGMM